MIPQNHPLDSLKTPFFYARALCGALSGGLAPPRSGFVLVPEGIVADDGTNKQRG